MSERLTIARMGHRGDGIADTDAGPVYAPYTLPGEIVEVEPVEGHPDRRLVQRVVEASAQRIAPICPHFGVCGGCALQHLETGSYRAWKRGLVIEALTQAGIETDVGELVDAHGAGRRRAVLHARRRGYGEIEVGFAAQRAHHIVPIDRCPIFAPALDGAITAAWSIAEVLDGSGKPLDIQVTATDTGLDVDVRGSGPIRAAATAELARAAERHRLARLTRHGELVAQRHVPVVTMGRAKVALPPGAFLQPTVAGEETLAALASGHCEGGKTVADLFCGVGPFALRIAERARVTAIDSEQGSVQALTRAVASSQGLKPIEATARDLFRRPLVPEELKRFDVVVFDPPRQGAEAQSRQLAASKVDRVVAVSCNPATFARDARILVGGGYRITALTPVDQFRYSYHAEIVARFER